MIIRAAILRSTPPPLFFRFIKASSFLPVSIHLSRRRRVMLSSASEPETRRRTQIHLVPGLSPEETASVAEMAFQRHSSRPSDPKRTGDGVAIMWFRNDLRVLDNEALARAWVGSAKVLPVYCVDPRNFGTTHCFGFPKTGALRAKFVIECLTDLRKNLMKRGLNLLIRNGKPEDILPSIAKALGAHTVRINLREGGISGH